jgi:hypothetical protein
MNYPTDDSSNRIRSVIDNVVGTEDPDDLMLELMGVLDEGGKVPESGKYYIFVYQPKTPNIQYDQNPLVAVSDVFSCDFSMGILNNILRYNVDDEVVQINLNDLDEDYEDDYIQFSLSDLDKEQPVIQLLFPSIHIWADFQDEYMWYEFLDHPLTAVNNNYTAIGGWFNIANHPRSTSLAVRFYDKSKIIKFKKGDPLYRIRFYTKDMNDEVSFIKKSPSKINLEAKKDMMNERRKLLGEDSQLMNQILFDKDSRKKCPFHYNNFENV